MSLYTRERKKRIRSYKRVHMKDSIEIGGSFFWQTHMIPEKIEKDAEFDYLVYNQKDMILLTIQNTKPYSKEIRKVSPRDCLRIYIGMRLEKPKDIKLEKVVAILKKIRSMKKKR